MNIGEAANQAGLPVKTVRYYSDIGLVLPSHRSTSGYRNYDSTTVKKLIFVKRARSFDFSIEDCRELLDLYQDKNRTSSNVRRIAKEHLIRIQKKESELKNLRLELNHLVKACAGDDRPDCPIIDYFS
tara:strand:+ start:140 stop:523 length:384 start_codon:yes stop_codon:yes gene_type:complete